jgi:hypothetical protein
VSGAAAASPFGEPASSAAAGSELRHGGLSFGIAASPSFSAATTAQPAFGGASSATVGSEGHSGFSFSAAAAPAGLFGAAASGPPLEAGSCSYYGSQRRKKLNGFSAAEANHTGLLFANTAFGAAAPVFGAAATSPFGNPASSATVGSELCHGGLSFGVAASPSFSAVATAQPGFGGASSATVGSEGHSGFSFGAAAAPALSAFNTASGAAASSPCSRLSFGATPAAFEAALSAATTAQPAFGAAAPVFGAAAATSPFGKPATSATVGSELCHGGSYLFGGQIAPSSGQPSFGGLGQTGAAKWQPTKDTTLGNDGFLFSISAMPSNMTRSHEELRWGEISCADKAFDRSGLSLDAATTAFNAATHPFGAAAAAGRKACAPAPPAEQPQVIRMGDGLTVVHGFTGFCRTHRASPEEFCAWVAEALALTPGLSVRQAEGNLDVVSTVAVLPAMVVEALLAFLRLVRRDPAGFPDGCDGPSEILHGCDGQDSNVQSGDVAPTSAVRSAALASLAVGAPTLGVGDGRATADGDGRSLEASDVLVFWELDEALANACGVRLTTVR